jgi:hypothetical protein
MKIKETLILDCKKPWQVGWGHRVVQQNGSIHTDKRVDKPGKGGRKADQLRKLYEG